MSMSALKWAREPRPGLGGPANAVLRDLADRANDTGVCWPAISTIVADTGYCERAVRSALRRLEQEKLLRTHHIKGRSSRYVLAIPRHEMPGGRHEMPDTPARDAPKASKNPKEKNRRTKVLDKPRQNATAYGKFDPNLPRVDVDPAIVAANLEWLRKK